jgi:hypothetical protein
MKTSSIILSAFLATTSAVKVQGPLNDEFVEAAVDARI